MLNLKDEEKAIVAVTRIQDSLIGEQLIPFCFKCKKEMIPSDLKLHRLSPKNTVSISVEGIRPLKAMIVGYGDDSKEVSAAYKIFLEKTKNLNAQKTINIWLSSSSINFTQIHVSSLQQISRSEFEHFLKVADFQKHAKVPKTSTPLKKNQEIIQLDSTDEKDQDSVHLKENQSASSSKHVLSKTEEDDHKKPSIQHVKEVVREVQAIAGYAVTQASIKAFNAKVARTFDVLYEYLESRDDSCKSKPKLRICERPDNYFIPTYDRTYESGSFTYIEGLLPVVTKKYSRAMNFIPLKLEELEPTLIVSAIVKFAFPKHWIVDVTLRGAGGRKSLINIWNHQNPVLNPCEGTFENGLGVSRLRALLDHAVRKCGKLSYDLAVEKALHTSIAKAMHYVRTQLAIKTSGKDPTDKESSFLNEDITFEHSPSSDNSSQDLNEPDINMRMTRKRTRESQIVNTLDKFPDDDSETGIFDKEDDERMVYEEKMTKKSKSCGKEKDSFFDSCNSLNQNITGTDSGLGVDKELSENIDLSENLSQKRQYSGIEPVNKRIRSSLETLRAIQEPEVILHENTEFSKPKMGPDENEKEVNLNLDDNAASSADCKSRQSESEAVSDSLFDTGLSSIRDPETDSDMKENFDEKNLGLTNEKSMQNEGSDSEQNMMPLTQALDAINSQEEDSIQDLGNLSSQDFKPGPAQEPEKKDLESFFAADPRSALLYMKKHNLFETFMSELSDKDKST